MTNEWITNITGIHYTKKIKYVNGLEFSSNTWEALELLGGQTINSASLFCSTGLRGYVRKINSNSEPSYNPSAYCNKF